MLLNGTISHITDPLWGESTDDPWIPLTKASDTGFDVSLIFALQTVGQIVELPVNWYKTTCHYLKQFLFSFLTHVYVTDLIDAYWVLVMKLIWVCYRCYLDEFLELSDVNFRKSDPQLVNMAFLSSFYMKVWLHKQLSVCIQFRVMWDLILSSVSVRLTNKCPIHNRFKTDKPCAISGWTLPDMSLNAPQQNWLHTDA